MAQPESLQMSLESRRLFSMIELRLFDITQTLSVLEKKQHLNQIKEISNRLYSLLMQAQVLYEEAKVQPLFGLARQTLINSSTLIVLLMEEVEKRVKDHQGRLHRSTEDQNAEEYEQNSKMILKDDRPVKESKDRPKLGGISLLREAHCRGFGFDDNCKRKKQLSELEKIKKEMEEMNSKDSNEGNSNLAEVDEIYQFIHQMKQREDSYNHVAYEEGLAEILELFKTSQEQTLQFLAKSNTSTLNEECTISFFEMLTQLKEKKRQQSTALTEKMNQLLHEYAKKHQSLVAHFEAENEKLAEKKRLMIASQCHRDVQTNDDYNTKMAELKKKIKQLEDKCEIYSALKAQVVSYQELYYQATGQVQVKELELARLKRSLAERDETIEVVLKSKRSPENGGIGEKHFSNKKAPHLVNKDKIMQSKKNGNIALLAKDIPGNQYTDKSDQSGKQELEGTDVNQTAANNLQARKHRVSYIGVSIEKGQDSDRKALYNTQKNAETEERVQKVELSRNIIQAARRRKLSPDNYFIGSGDHNKIPFVPINEKKLINQSYQPSVSFENKDTKKNSLKDKIPPGSQQTQQVSVQQGDKALTMTKTFPQANAPSQANKNSSSRNSSANKSKLLQVERRFRTVKQVDQQQKQVGHEEHYNMSVKDQIIDNDRPIHNSQVYQQGSKIIHHISGRSQQIPNQDANYKSQQRPNDKTSHQVSRVNRQNIKVSPNKSIDKAFTSVLIQAGDYQINRPFQPSVQFTNQEHRVAVNTVINNPNNLSDPNRSERASYQSLESNDEQNQFKRYHALPISRNVSRVLLHSLAGGCNAFNRQSDRTIGAENIQSQNNQIKISYNINSRSSCSKEYAVLSVSQTVAISINPYQWVPFAAKKIFHNKNKSQMSLASKNSSLYSTVIKQNQQNSKGKDALPIYACSDDQVIDKEPKGPNAAISFDSSGTSSPIHAKNNSLSQVKSLSLIKQGSVYASLSSHKKKVNRQDLSLPFEHQMNLTLYQLNLSPIQVDQLVKAFIERRLKSQAQPQLHQSLLTAQQDAKPETNRLLSLLQIMVQPTDNSQTISSALVQSLSSLAQSHPQYLATHKHTGNCRKSCIHLASYTNKIKKIFAKQLTTRRITMKLPIERIGEIDGPESSTESERGAISNWASRTMTMNMNNLYAEPKTLPNIFKPRR